MEVSVKKHTHHRKPFVLVVLDGWGIAPDALGNAIKLADTPVMDSFRAKYPYTTLAASGESVGLLPGQDGNSEAGHLNIGAGRIVEQDVLMVDKSIKDGTFQKNPAFEEAVQHVGKTGGNLHIMGLLSDWHSAHANPDHLYELLKFTRIKKVKNVFLHLFTDGRDTPPYAGMDFIKDLTSRLRSNDMIATLMGRVYLDRKKNWERTEKAYNALVLGEGNHENDAVKAVEEAYKRGETDEYVAPTTIGEASVKLMRIDDEDSVIFYNLRSDRARQLTKPFVQSDFNRMNPNSFKRKKVLHDLIFVAMTDFGPDLGDILTAFPSPDVKQTLPMILKNKMQYYIAESEKYAHMTYFFNGGYSDPVGRENRILVDSPDVLTYENTPAMSAIAITDIVVETIGHSLADFIAINFANPDMVAHTGNLQKTIVAIELIDKQVGILSKTVLAHDGTMIVTADHGNAEGLFDEKGKVDTEHSANPVPFSLISAKYVSVKLRPNGVLGDVAPTILDLMNIKKPIEMTGRSLIV